MILIDDDADRILHVGTRFCRYFLTRPACSHSTHMNVYILLTLHHIQSQSLTRSTSPKKEIPRPSFASSRVTICDLLT